MFTNETNITAGAQEVNARQSKKISERTNINRQIHHQYEGKRD
jgi:hypothetical protein